MAVTTITLVAGCGSGESPEAAGEADVDAPTTAPATAPPGSPSVATSDPSGVPGGAVAVEDLQRFADELVSSTGSDGGIVAVQAGDAAPVTVVSGMADTEAGVELPPVGSFHVASVTKSYVAAAALALAEAGVLDLDEPIDRWIDWPGGDRITLRQLLQHTAGVDAFGAAGTDSDLFVQLVLDQGHSYTIDEVLDATRDLAPLDEPGASTTYSNLGYVLAGAVLEAATGQTLGDVLEQRVFGPAGLDATWYAPDAETAETGSGDLPAPLPGLYDFDPGSEPISTTDFSMASWETLVGPASGAVSTMDDYLRWGDIVLRDRALDGLDLASMSSIGPGGYGLGVVGVTADGACVFDGCPSGATFTRTSLNGDMPGASTRLLYDPTSDTLVAVYLNRNGLSLDGPMLGFVEDHLAG